MITRVTCDDCLESGDGPLLSRRFCSYALWIASVRTSVTSSGSGRHSPRTRNDPLDIEHSLN